MNLEESEHLCFIYLCENFQNRKERVRVEDFHSQKEIEIPDQSESAEIYSGYHEASMHVYDCDGLEQFD